MTDARYMEETMGGDVKKQIIKYGFVMFKCTCTNLIENPNIMGYEHSGGVKDATGKKWWMYVHCSKCEYDWALHKIDKQVQKMEKDSLPYHYNRFFNDMKEGEMKARKNKTSPSACVLFLLYNPTYVDVIPLVGITGRSPLDFVKPILERIDHKPDAYVVVAEAWFRMLKKEERENFKENLKNKNYHYGDIQKSPDRKECLVINGATLDGSWRKSEMLLIQRGLNHEIVGYADNHTEVPSMHSNKLPGMKGLDEPSDYDIGLVGKKKKEVK